MPPSRALAAALAFAGVLALAAINRLAGWQADRAVLWTYDIVVTCVAVVLLVDLLRGHWADAVITDLVVDLGTRADTGTLQQRIGRALGDHSLVLGYWLADEARYVDDTGHPVEVERPGPGRMITPVADASGQPLAVLVHDTAVLADPDLVTPSPQPQASPSPTPASTPRPANASMSSPPPDDASSTPATPSGSRSSVISATVCKRISPPPPPD